MSVKCNDFLSFAEDCLNNRSDEIGYRNSTARAYYSCYHKLKPLLKNAPNGHSKLIDYLCNANESYNENFKPEDLRALGLKLEVEKKKRVHADYFLDKSFNRMHAETSVVSAHKFRRELDLLVQNVSSLPSDATPNPQP